MKQYLMLQGDTYILGRYMTDAGVRLHCNRTIDPTNKAKPLSSALRIEVENGVPRLVEVWRDINTTIPTDHEMQIGDHVILDMDEYGSEEVDTTVPS